MTDRELLPDVAAYMKAVETAHCVRNAERAAISKKYPISYKPAVYGTPEYTASEMRSKLNKESVDRYNAAMLAAREELEGSSDPLVAWIAENAWDHTAEVLELLERLPMTVEELDEFADDQEWCRAYTRLRLEAQQAGVLPGLEPLSPDEHALLGWVIEKADDRLSALELREFGSLVDSIRAEVRRNMP